MNSMQPFFPNMNYQNININQELRMLENRICNLEKELIMIKNELNQKKTNDNYTINYQPNSYNMM